MKKGIKIESIIDLYNKGLTPVQISEELNCTIANITRRLKKANIKVIPNYSKSRRTRKGYYSLNEDYFYFIDDETSAYLLGLMYADGSVVSNGCYLKMKEEESLIKLIDAIKGNMPIKKYTRIYKNKEFSCYIISIYSMKIKSNLIKWGCHPNKTFDIRLPNINPVLLPHFIRGFFDGDGCISIGKTISRLHFNITSAALDFLNDIRPILSNIATKNGSIYKEKNTNTYHLRYTGKAALNILNWLYKDSTIYLNRKYIKYKIVSRIKIGRIAGKSKLDNQQPSLGSA